MFPLRSYAMLPFQIQPPPFLNFLILLLLLLLQTVLPHSLQCPRLKVLKNLNKTITVLPLLWAAEHPRATSATEKSWKRETWKGCKTFCTRLHILKPVVFPSLTHTHARKVRTHTSQNICLKFSPWQTCRLSLNTPINLWRTRALPRKEPRPLNALHNLMSAIRLWRALLRATLLCFIATVHFSSALKRILVPDLLQGHLHQHVCFQMAE